MQTHRFLGRKATLIAGLVLGAGAAVTPPDATAATSSVASLAIRVPNTQYYSGTMGVDRGMLYVGDMGTSPCRLTKIQPQTLRILSNGPTTCDDPRLYGQTVAPVEEIVPRGSNDGDVRIAVFDHATGSVHLGPIVMRYGNYSDGRPEWTYGGGDLWLYDVGTDSYSQPTKYPAEVLRISATTGAVLSTVKMPELSRIDLAANDDGLWFGQTDETGWQQGNPPALLYFLGSGASAPRVIEHRSGSVNWLVASGHTAWVSINVTTSAQGGNVTQQFQSPTGKPRSVTDATTTPSPSDIGEGDADAAPVLEDPGFGLVAAVPGWLGSVSGQSSGQRVVELNPLTGSASTLASFPTAPRSVLYANAVFGGYLYVLEGPQGGSSSAVLYRVRLLEPPVTLRAPVETSKR